MAETTMTVFYVGVLDGSDDVWGVSIADIHGCVGGGSTPERAIEDAALALADVAQYMATHSVPLPNPRTSKEIIEAGEVDVYAGETTVLIPLLLDSGRTVRANITLDAGLLETIDAQAKLRGLTRSAFLASAAREKIAAQR
jgi:predicted RNase H-like HicB family nuclease